MDGSYSIYRVDTIFDRLDLVGRSNVALVKQNCVRAGYLSIVGSAKYWGPKKKGAYSIRADCPSDEEASSICLDSSALVAEGEEKL